MISLLFDLICAGFLFSLVFIALQFKIGFMVNRELGAFGYKLKVSGEKERSLQYSIWKE